MTRLLPVLWRYFLYFKKYFGLLHVVKLYIVEIPGKVVYVLKFGTCMKVNFKMAPYKILSRLRKASLITISLVQIVLTTY